MMAALFLVFTLAMFAIYAKQRRLAMSIIAIGIVLCLLMFWHHVTTILDINL